MSTLRERSESKTIHPLIWLASTYTICLTEWHKQKYKPLWLLAALMVLLLINWFKLNLPIQGYQAYSKYMPMKSYLTIKQNPYSTTDPIYEYQPLLFTGHKQIVWYTCDKYRNARGVHIQLNKADLIPVNKQVAIDNDIVPNGYVPYWFDSVVYNDFPLLSKQVLLDSSITNDPNYYNNFYTLPTQVKYGGLYAKNNDLYKKSMFYAAALDPNGYRLFPYDALPKRLLSYKNFTPYFGYYDTNYNTIDYESSEIQDSPLYIQAQLINALKELPNNYYLDLAISLSYSYTGFVDEIDYDWTFFDKQGKTLTEHNVKLPIMHVKGKAVKHVSVNGFLPDNTYDAGYSSLDVPYYRGHPGSLFSDLEYRNGGLPWQVIFFGYRLTDDTYAIENNPEFSMLHYSSDYTKLLNYFKNHHSLLLELKLYSEIELIIKAILLLIILVLFNKLFAASINKLAHKKVTD